MGGEATQTRRGQRRLIRLILFSLAVLVLGGCLNLYRSAQALQQIDALEDWAAKEPLQRLAATSLVWGLIFIACAVGLWRQKRWGWVWTPIATSVYHAHIWFNHLLLDTSDYAQKVRPWALANTVVVLLFVWGFSYLPSIRAVYRKRPPKDRARSGECQSQ